MQELLYIGWQEHQNAIEEEDDALANIGAVISNPFQFMSDPEPIRHTLNNEWIFI